MRGGKAEMSCPLSYCSVTIRKAPSCASFKKHSDLNSQRTSLEAFQNFARNFSELRPKLFRTLICKLSNASR